MMTELEALPAQSVAVSVMLLEPASKGIAGTVQSTCAAGLGIDAIPDPPRLLTHLIESTRKLSFALPPRVRLFVPEPDCEATAMLGPCLSHL